MKKKFAIIPIGIFFIFLGLFFSQEKEESEFEHHSESLPTADVYMPNKSSRPGCEVNDTCYIPSTITIKVGETVTWQNQDVAFHSVTSGSYDAPTGDFDSGHLDPDEFFSITFENVGIIDYFCTLHPWMKGKVIVDSK